MLVTPAHRCQYHFVQQISPDFLAILVLNLSGKFSGKRRYHRGYKNKSNQSGGGRLPGWLPALLDGT